MLQKLPYEPFPGGDRVLTEPASGLLGPPAPHHGFDHRVLRAQLGYPGDQFQVSCPRQGGASL
ncbi:hypothetical protein [Streptomyces sp. 2132.2]|uniref:hypothetical protein n=1 Tax=Streptomyces sp. 2132.2 TaxID=2485161 RepID=UPI0021A7841B|nr:hypothetical protein [Streptomyces sp. 2132.2]